MSILYPSGPKLPRFSALYDFLTQSLTLTADGTKRWGLPDPFFQQEERVGALFFSLRAYIPLEPPPGSIELDDPFHIKAKFKVHLPQECFDNDNVYIEVAGTVVKVRIDYIFLTGKSAQNGDATGVVKATDADTATVVSSPVKTEVLPPRELYLPAGRTVDIKAIIPTPLDIGGGAYTNIYLNPKVLALDNASTTSSYLFEALTSHITWSIKWAPDLVIADPFPPQRVNVVTTRDGGYHGDDTKVTRSVQTYLIYLTLLKDKA
ncbi:hypothetical protein B0T26DRAFT_755759 [Lasiosphaeria miniovina]|uniref:Uncharacterized protein n=1 Tax=Lasiosphaeria miniovina TaxID=1954250 RepID=A0AA40DK86_9PEZI|nr:uncharacterized protein B0T26DRAFT_755759 [Lasiosphaeria miniovina]KAK0706235.1 hypothetical protein B0T26DRAFT_755759 [Lasiosphaeria miniovina]